MDESDAGSQRSTPVLTRNVWGGSISQNSFSSAGKEGLKYDNDDIDYDNDNDNNNDDAEKIKYCPPLIGTLQASSTSSNSSVHTSTSSVNSEKILFQGFNRNFMKFSNSKNNSPLDGSGTYRRRSYSVGSDELSDDYGYGWFEDFESPSGFVRKRNSSSSSSTNSDSPDILGVGVGGTGGANHQSGSIKRTLSLPLPASDTPMYILESSLANQRLWYETAGKRPKQPDSEREYFQKLWFENFENSNVQYNHNEISNVEAAANCNYDKVRRLPQGDEDEIEIMYKGKGPFSNSVSKAFVDHHFSTITLQMPRFKISKDKNGVVFASFLVVVALNGVTFGVWKRHTDFKNLAEKLSCTTTTDSKDVDTCSGDNNYDDNNDKENNYDVTESCVEVRNGNDNSFGEDGKKRSGDDGDDDGHRNSNSSVPNDENFKNSLLSWQCLMYRKQWFRCLDKGT